MPHEGFTIPYSGLVYLHVLDDDPDKIRRFRKRVEEYGIKGDDLIPFADSMRVPTAMTAATTTRAARV